MQSLNREKLIYQVLGRVSVELPKSDRKTMRQIESALKYDMPQVADLKEIYITKGFICRSSVEEFMDSGEFPVRVTTLVAKAITKSFK
jgi:hypothetical protein